MITVVIWCNVIHHHYSQAGLFSTVLETISSTGLGFRLDLYSNGSVGLRVDYTRWVGKKASATSDAEWRPSVSPYFGIPALCGSSTLTFTSYPCIPSLWSTVPQHTFLISFKPQHNEQIYCPLYHTIGHDTNPEMTRSDQWAKKIEVQAFIGFRWRPIRKGN